MIDKSEFIMYQTEDGKTKIDVKLKDETVWLTQSQMSELFQRDISVISRHINNVFEENEVDKKSNLQNLQIPNSDRSVVFYSLDVIISVGYRVKSLRGTQFRIWANTVLKEYIKKGFVMNDELLKKAGGGGYWKELLERIRDIRSSEKIFYRQVLDLYATSVDYNSKSDESIEFFKMVQNKMHFAAHGNTAPEVVYNRADSNKPFMELTTFTGNFPKKSDVIIAKNYLSENELKILNRMVSAFLDLAELRAIQEHHMYMKDWVKELDDFAGRYGKGILESAGKISHLEAKIKSEKEFIKFQEKIEAEGLTQVETDYIERLKKEQKLIEKSIKGN